MLKNCSLMEGWWQPTTDLPYQEKSWTRFSFCEKTHWWQTSILAGYKKNIHLYLNYKDSQCVIKTLPKAQRTRGLSSFCQSKFLRSYHKFKHKSASTKNPNQTSASPQNLKFKILTKPSFRISTKIQLHNIYKITVPKCWTNSSFKILPEL